MTVYECPYDECDYRNATKEGVAMHHINKPGHPDRKKFDIMTELNSGNGSDSAGSDGQETDTDHEDSSPGDNTDPENPPADDDTGGGSDKTTEPPFPDPSSSDGQSDGSDGTDTSDSSDGQTAEWYGVPEGYLAELDTDRHEGHPTGWLECDGSEEYNYADGKLRDDGTVWHVKAVHEPGDV